MTGSRLLVGVASVLAGTTVLMGVFGFVYNPVLLVAAVPFAAATYFLWSHGTGRLEARMRQRTRARGVGARDESGPPGGGTSAEFGPGSRGTTRSDGPSFVGETAQGRSDATSRGRSNAAGRSRPAAAEHPQPSQTAAAGILGVAPDADEATIRRAFRERARDLHPDAPGGDGDEFKRVKAAYERLTDG